MYSDRLLGLWTAWKDGQFIEFLVVQDLHPLPRLMWCGESVAVKPKFFLFSKIQVDHSCQLTLALIYIDSPNNIFIITLWRRPNYLRTIISKL